MMIEARVKKSYYTRVAIIAVIAFLPSLFLLFKLPGWTKLLALLFSTPPFIMLLLQRRWAKLFDDAGVTRRDGRQFRWHDLKDIKYVRVRARSGLTYLNHIELIFNDGKAMVFHLMLENAGEVMRRLEQLQSQRPAATSDFTHFARRSAKKKAARCEPLSYRSL
ncbi:MAG: hypothetical protein AB1631_13060 [Acidobacteriota bacterium]